MHRFNVFSLLGRADQTSTYPRRKEGGELFVSGDLTPCFDGGLSVFFSY